MNKTALLSFLIFISVIFISIIAFFYYIKPQREFIKTNTQECIKQAMAQINEEVEKAHQGIYKSKIWFNELLNRQEADVESCISNYNSILFSKPEKELVILNINSLITDQENKIQKYLKASDDKIRESNRIKDEKIRQENEKKARKKACDDMQKMKEDYMKCLEDEIEKNPDQSSSIVDMMLSPNKNDSNNDCLQKYNYFKFNVSESDCIWVNLFSL